MSKKPAFHLPPKAAKKDTKADPRDFLKKAMARHDLHASGAESANAASNAKLKADLQAALDAMDAEEAGETAEEAGEPKAA